MSSVAPDSMTRPNVGLLGRFSFRTLAMMATAGIIAATTLVLTHVNEQQTRGIIEQEAESNLLLEARNLAILSSDVLLGEFPELTLVPLIKDMQRGRPELVQILVLDRSSRIVGGPQPRQIGETHTPTGNMEPLVTRILMNPSEILVGNSEQIQISSPVRHHSEGYIGRVLMSLDRSLIRDKINASRIAMIRTSAILLTVAVALVMVVITILFRPVGVLRQGLRRIGEGDLDTPIRIAGPSELIRLAENLNKMTAQLKASRKLAEAREAETIATQREIIFTLGEVVESRSHETANHTRRVGAMSAELARLAGLPAMDAEMLRMAAPVHDVGKIGIPDSILNKPSRLTPSEFETMKTHANIGYRILAGSDRPILKAAAIIAHEHHERWDGGGYPRGLTREEINVFGRIVSLTDVFDALYSDRVYRTALPLEDVLDYLGRERGTRFDPNLVDLFLANTDRFIAICERLRDSRMRGEPVEVPVEVPVEMCPSQAVEELLAEPGAAVPTP